MTIQQARDLEFLIYDSDGKNAEILIGLYATPGNITAWALVLSVPTPTGGWSALVQDPITSGAFSAYEDDDVMRFLERFCETAAILLSRHYGDYGDPVVIPDDDPTTESREEYWVRMLKDHLEIRDNRPAVK